MIACVVMPVGQVFLLRFRDWMRPSGGDKDRVAGGVKAASEFGRY